MTKSFRPNATTHYNNLMRFRLRTLLIVLALGPPVLAVVIYVWAMLSGYKPRDDPPSLDEIMMSNLANSKPMPTFDRKHEK
jgi:hypothetical protein